MDGFVSNSSFISSVVYYVDYAEMIVYMRSGKSYSYHHVPINVFKQFKTAGSHGKFWNNYIKGNYA